MPVKEKEVIAWLSERKLMPSPELVSHISNHPEGLGLLERTVTSLTEPKLFLGISDLVEEESAEAPKPIKRKKVAEIPPVIIERQIQKSKLRYAAKYPPIKVENGECPLCFYKQVSSNGICVMCLTPLMTLNDDGDDDDDDE